MKILSSFTHLQVVQPTLCECLCSAEHKGIYFEESLLLGCFGALLTSKVGKNTMKVNAAQNRSVSHTLQNISESPLLTLYLPSLADSRKPDFHQSLVHVWGHSTVWCGSPWACVLLLLFETEPSQRSTVFTSEKITNVCRPQMFMTQMVKDMFITDDLSDHTVLF